MWWLIVLGLLILTPLVFGVFVVTDPYGPGAEKRAAILTAVAMFFATLSAVNYGIYIMVQGG